MKSIDSRKAKITLLYAKQKIIALKIMTNNNICITLLPLRSSKIEPALMNEVKQQSAIREEVQTKQMVTLAPVGLRQEIVRSSTPKYATANQ